MRLLASLAIAFAAWLLAGGAFAQGYDPFCVDQVERFCEGEATHECAQYDDFWDNIDDFCVGDVQSLIEDSRLAYEDLGSDDSGTYYADTTYATLGGYSYGGQLRGGPGTEYAQVGSLQEGDWLEIVEGTGIWFNDYQWFLVDTEYGQAYHWGGIMCTEGSSPIEGVFTGCN